MSLTDKLENLLRAVDKQAAAEIDAAACQTKRDREKAHKCQETRYQLQELFEQELAKLETKNQQQRMEIWRLKQELKHHHP